MRIVIIVPTLSKKNFLESMMFNIISETDIDSVLSFIPQFPKRPENTNN